VLPKIPFGYFLKNQRITDSFLSSQVRDEGVTFFKGTGNIRTWSMRERWRRIRRTKIGEFHRTVFLKLRHNNMDFSRSKNLNKRNYLIPSSLIQLHPLLRNLPPLLEVLILSKLKPNSDPSLPIAHYSRKSSIKDSIGSSNRTTYSHHSNTVSEKVEIQPKP